MVSEIRRRETFFWQSARRAWTHSDEVLQGWVRGPGAAQRVWAPNVDVYEEENAFVVIVELAGMNPDEINVSFSSDTNRLTIKGNRKSPLCSSVRRCFQLEVLYGEFERHISLPGWHVDVEAITARYDNGMLTITLPKKERRAERRTYTITHE